MAARAAGAAVALLGLAASTIGAQTIRGIVADRSDAPASGVVVQLLDSTSAVAARTLTNGRGEFRVTASAAGAYRVRTLRIGYRPSISEPIALRAGVDVLRRITLDGVPISLDTVRVSSHSACEGIGDSTGAAYAVWEQARAALTAAEVTASARNVFATTITYERTLDPNTRMVVRETAKSHSDYVRQPWRSAAPDSLHGVGYAVTDGDNSTAYSAPGLDMLLSPIFVEDHCFRVAADGGRVGLVFEPAPTRRAAEIRGTLWLDRATAALQRLSFQYANVPPEQQEYAGGEMRFVRMADGTWAIGAWSIRMPVSEMRIRSRALGGIDARVAELRVVGGNLALARRGADTLWSEAPFVLTGAVADSASGAAVPRARVRLRGTALAGTTDSLGRFGIPGALPGEYTLEIRTPSLDSVNTVHRSTVLVVDSATAVSVRVPNARQVAAMLCGTKPRRDVGIVVGSVSAQDDSVPPRGVVVSAEWQTGPASGQTAASTSAALRHHTDTHADGAGLFRVCDVPANTTITLRAASENAGAKPVETRITPQSLFVRANLTLERGVARGATFAGAVLVDSTAVPIAGAEVSLPELGKSTLTDGRGAFHLADIPPGAHRLVVRRLGFGASMRRSRSRRRAPRSGRST